MCDVLLSLRTGGGRTGVQFRYHACSILAQTAAYSPAARSAIMEGSGLLGFLVGLFGGLLGCLLVFLMQRPGAPKPGTSASDEAEDSQDRIQTAPAHGEGQAVPGTSSPPTDSKGPKDDDDKDAGSPVGTAMKPDPTSTSPTSPKSPGTPSQKPDSTTATAAAQVDRDSQLSDATLLHLKDWLGEEMKKIVQPGLRQLRDDNREVLKSLHEILGDKSKVDLLVEKVDHSRDVLKDLHEILEDKSKLDQIAGQVEVLEAQISNIVQDVTWMGKVVHDESSTVIKIEKELADLKDLSARRHASVEVSTEGTQEQLRGLKRDSDALYSSLRDHRQNHKEIHVEHARRFMEMLKELNSLASKVHNGFAGLSGIGRSAQSAAQDAKEAAERGLEIGEKTLAAIRVGGPSPSEKELLEMVGDLQKTLADTREELADVGKTVEALKASGTPMPPPPATAAPAQMGGASTVPPPPQHVPNLLNLTQPPAHPWHQGGPTAAVMLGNPQQIFRALAGHQDVNN